ncbi:MAG: glycosyltransferase family 39 protein [Chloroflexi bacterium]|nr:glycosyltransferase family 39 protein [Chloroflexota bacterium]
MLATGKAATAAPAPSTTAHGRAQTWTRSGLLLDMLATVALMVAALAARLPYLQTAPRFRDDTLNAAWSLRIYRGQHFPFTDVEAYIGAFFNYAVAAGMFVVGPTIYAARTIVTYFGVATVGATYWLGRELGGPTAGPAVGLIAAAFMTTNGIHIAPVGHVAFSGSITPLFTTLAFWLLHRWNVRRTNGTLVWAGLMLGMSMHTHPTIVAFLPGAAGFIFWRNWSMLRTRWPWLALAAFLVAFSPMIAFNIITGGQSIRHAMYTASERPDYVDPKKADQAKLTVTNYLQREEDYWLLLHGTLGGAVDERDSTVAYLTDPYLASMSLLSVAAVAWAAVRHRYRLPLWLGASFALLLPVFNVAHYDVEYDGRYVLPLLPMIYAAVGVLVVDLWRMAAAKLAAPAARMGVAAGLGLAVVVMAGVPLLFLARYYERASRSEPTNASLVRAMDQVRSVLGAGQTVLLDENMNNRRTERADPLKDEASTIRVMKYILEFEDAPFETAYVDAGVLGEYQRLGRPTVVVLASGVDSKETAKLGDLIEQFGMTGLDGRAARPPRPADRYGLYLLPAGPATTTGRP